MARFGAVVTAMVTPFDEEGRVDLDAAASLARWLVDHGSDGLVVTGSTGEATALTDAERVDLWRVVTEAVTVPVVAGTASAATEHTVELTRQAAECGVAGAIVVTPYYCRPSQAGLEAHYRAVASAVELPLLLYDIPSRTGRRIDHATVLKLARELTNVVGIKDAAGDVGAAARLVAAAPGHFELYSGDNSLTLALLSVGAVGVVGVATHWAGSQMSELITAFEKGDATRARHVNASLFDSYTFASSDEAPNPVPTKAMMRVLGLPVGQCRPPMGPTPPGLEDRAREVFSGLG